MSKRFQIARIAVFPIAILVLASPILTAPGNPNKPNIVLVLMDNFGCGEIGV